MIRGFINLVMFSHSLTDPLHKHELIRMNATHLLCVLCIAYTQTLIVSECRI